MANRTLSESTETITALRDGANAVQALLQRLRLISGETIDLSSEVDTRDYNALTNATLHCLADNLSGTGPLRKQGFMRALTHLLCMVSDGVTPGKNWDPIEGTAPSFERRSGSTNPTAVRSQTASEPSAPHREGVKHIRGEYGHDAYVGTAAAIVACGLVEEHQLPGQPGRGKMSCTYHPDGTPKKKGNSASWMPGTFSIRKLGKGDRYIVVVHVSEQEEDRRQKVRAARRAVELAAEKSSTRHIGQPAVVHHSANFSVRRQLPVSWQVITNPNPPMRYGMQ